jgi:hypothetical protein
MQFDKNKSAYIHQWYPFVEGYSKEFITSIIDELDYKPKHAFDPFVGSGTTPLELQEIGIKCSSFEVSPFMHKLATVKLERSYNQNGFQNALDAVCHNLNGKLLPIRNIMEPPIAKTIQQRKGLDKWLFNRPVMDGILDIKHVICKIGDEKYKDLFTIALASILLDVSNVYRDGKSVKYKKDWKRIKIKRRDVHLKFVTVLKETFLPDIILLESKEIVVENKDLCILGDVREGIKDFKDDSIDLVITSPPYLNSRDYTDIYIAELWVLGFIKNYDELRSLRNRTIRSHVQVKHGDIEIIDSQELRNVIGKLSENTKDHWNKEIIGMIKGYFLDMKNLFIELRKKMQSEKKIFFNVANSAYYGVEIKVDMIMAEIAENCGFKVEEVRKARDLKPSSQQKDLIDSLRESIIVLTS